MTELPARIKPLVSGWTGQIPSAVDMERGEIALNTADKRLYTKHGDDQVYEVGRPNLKDLDDYGGQNLPADGSFLTFDYASGTWQDSTVTLVANIDDLGDVDTSTTAPTDGQVLTWVNANSQWEPADATGGGGAVSSVNTQTGVVSLGIEDMDDFDFRYDSGAPQWRMDTVTTQPTDLSSGEGALLTPFYVELHVNKIDDTGVDRTTQFMGLQVNDVLTFSWNGGANTITKTVNLAPSDEGSTMKVRVNSSSETWANNQVVEITGGTLSANPTAIPKTTGELLTWNGITGKYEPTPHAVPALGDLTNVAATAATDGQVLTWVNANSQWEPATPSAGGATAIDELTDVDTSSVAPTDGQVLTWVDANSQWEPATPTTPSLVDIGDVAYATDSQTLSAGVRVAGAGQPVTGQYRTDSTDTFLSYGENNANTLYSNMALLQVGDSVRLRYGNGGDITRTVAQAQAMNDFNSNYIRFTANIGYAAADGESLAITSSRFTIGGAAVPPTDGQVLTWVNANSQWEPVDVPAHVDAVSSVNGQTGVVSVGIADMDDFDYQQATGATPAWLMQTTGDGFDISSGEGVVWTNVTINLALWNTDGNGVDRTSQLAGLQNGDTITFTYSGGTLSRTIVDTPFENGGWYWIKINTWGTPPWASNELVEVTGGTLTAASTPLPIADGQVLTWVNANSRWEPVDTPVHVDAVSSVNGETGVVSLGVQDMDDFAYQVTTYQGDGDYIADGSDDLNALGYGRYQFVGSDEIAFAKDGNYPDGGAYDTAIDGMWDTWLAGSMTSLWISTDDAIYTEYAVTSASTQAGPGGPDIVRVVFSDPRPNVDPNTDMIWVEFSQPASGTPISIVDGQVLTWDNANSKWEPADAQAVAFPVESLTNYAEQIVINSNY